MKKYLSKTMVITIFFGLIFGLFILGVTSLKAITKPNDLLWDSWDEQNSQGNNWGQEFIKLPSAWDKTIGSSLIKTGIIDTGFDREHEDLKDNISLVGRSTWWIFEHGNHVAGIIGAKGNNNKGISGVTWDASMLVYGVGFFKEVDGRYETRLSPPLILIGIEEAVSEGAKIINYSAGIYSQDTRFLKDQIKTWHFIIDKINQQNDVLFVFAAGNEKDSFLFFSPAHLSLSYNNVISVAAIDQNGNLANFSNYGDVTVVAPGVDIFSTLPNNSYGNMSGTSMAAPFVSGLAGLIWSRAEELGKTLTAAEVKQLIIDGAVAGGKYAEGPDGVKIPIINAYESLKLLEPQYCGDGIINGTEQCDSTELGGATCESVMGATYAGSLACASDCNYNTSDCYEIQVNAKAPWSTLGYDGTRSGQSIYNGPTTNNIKWKYTATSAWGSPYFGIVPVVGQNGTIYIGNETEGKLYAFNTNGTVKWIFSNNGNPLGAHLSAPTISDGGTIYIGSSAGILFAINPDGTEKWKYELDTGHWVGTPVVDEEGGIYFTTTYPSVDNKPDYLYAINSDGTLKWRYEIESFSGIAHTAIGPDGTIYSSSIYTYSYNDLLYAILPNGNLKWKKFYRPGTSPVVGPDGTIYFKSVYLGLEAVNPDDGSLKWYNRLYPRLKPSVSKNNIIIVDDSTGLYALNLDGTEKWKNDQIGSVYNSSATIGDDGTVYIATNLGLFALDISDGSIKWKIDGISGTSPAIGADGTLYAGLSAIGP
ncbi:S8 family serine peptidase [Patescibacteria group bacterium]|nr:S8 family serine peptidase [Patescibacteria group bacterium]